MDKISEEMKTEKDFIEKMEASSVKKEAIPKNLKLISNVKIFKWK